MINGWEGKRKIYCVYEAPKDWHIIAFHPVIVSNSIKAAYAFSTASSSLHFHSLSAVYAKPIELLEYAAEKNVFEKYGHKYNKCGLILISM